MASNKPVKHSYVEMIQVALLTLNERGGASRQQMWKCIEAKFPEANKVQFALALKKCSAAEKNFLVPGKTKQRFALSPEFRKNIQKRLATGLPLVKAL